MRGRARPELMIPCFRSVLDDDAAEPAPIPLPLPAAFSTPPGLSFAPSVVGMCDATANESLKR